MNAKQKRLFADYVLFVLGQPIVGQLILQIVAREQLKKGGWDEVALSDSQLTKLTGLSRMTVRNQVAALVVSAHLIKQSDPTRYKVALKCPRFLSRCNESYVWVIETGKLSLCCWSGGAAGAEAAQRRANSAGGRPLSELCGRYSL